MAISEFKLTGLGRSGSFTCEPLTNENIFWPKSGLSKDRFGALWNYVKGGSWTGKEIAVIQHDGVNQEGIPINGVVIEVKGI